MSTYNGSRQPIRRTIGQLINDQQSNNDIMPLAGGDKVQRRVQATQDLLLADPYAALKRIDNKYKFKPKEGDQLVVPETCLYWLSLNISNRIVTDARVYDLSEHMVADEWHNTFNPVMFYTGDGGRTFILANGQTRLWAGWLTGCTVEHTVRITNDPKVLVHIDDHKARTVGDLLSTKKYANYNVLASATGFVRAYQEFDPPFAGSATMHNGPHFQRAEILEFVEDNPEFITAVGEGHRALKWTKRMLRSPSMTCALYYLTGLSSPRSSVFEKFWDAMETGVGLEASNPVLRLRQLLIANMTAPRRYDPLNVAAMVVKTWNLVNAGRARGRIGWAAYTERFPSIT
jgi:hypothetical protein